MPLLLTAYTLTLTLTLNMPLPHFKLKATINE